MTVIHKEFTITRQGDLMVASTPSFDRANDRVFPLGGNLTNFSANPVVMWGHNYTDPWAIIGRADDMQVTSDGIQFRPVLRPAANDYDPQNIILSLWDNNFVRTSSIGFRPLEARPNERGGTDYTSWELLEISIVGIPMNQDALRLAAKGIADLDEVITRAGRVLSKANEGRIRTAVTELQTVLDSLGMQEGDEDTKSSNGNDQGAVILALSEYFSKFAKKVSR